MNARSWLKTAQTKINRLDAELILAHILNCERTFLHAHSDQQLTNAQQKLADNLLKHRQNHEPLAYLTGEKEFYGRKFKTTKDTLVPRPETESIIDLAKPLNPKTILDVGTGSGCIAITLALELPNAQVTAVDISKKALKITQENAKKYPQLVITSFQSDLCNSSKLRDKRFNLITANLPYVNPEWSWNSPSLQHEPKMALYADNNGLALIKKLLLEAPNHLTPNAHLLLEADQSQHAEIISFATSQNFSHIQTNGLIIQLQSKQ